MKIIFDGKTITMADKDVKLAKKLIYNFLEKTNEVATEKGNPYFYYEMLICMYIMANDNIKGMGSDLIATMLNSVAESRKQNA